jgi:hypothetical protein
MTEPDPDLVAEVALRRRADGLPIPDDRVAEFARSIARLRRVLAPLRTPKPAGALFGGSDGRD